MPSRPGPKLQSLLGVVVTLTTLYMVPNTLPALALLMAIWTLVLYPLRAEELVMWGVAAIFFLAQNYACLRAGLFEFRDKDVLLMPYYEPFLWGFYFVSMKRFVSSGEREDASFTVTSVAGLLATSTAFSLFSYDSRALLLATLLSTTFLFVLFHSRLDVYYALYALGLGFVIEIFGVSAGLWSYPAPDFLGIPYWFATMWLSVGVLGRRFLIPAAAWIAARGCSR